jgi:hypothetical protein
MPQLNGSLKLLQIKCPPLAAAHAPAISQC